MKPLSSLDARRMITKWFAGALACMMWVTNGTVVKCSTITKRISSELMKEARMLPRLIACEDSLGFGGKENKVPASSNMAQTGKKKHGCLRTIGFSPPEDTKASDLE